MGPRRFCSIFVFLLSLVSAKGAGVLPEFESDEAADRWLRENSAYYRMVATKVDRESGYSFRGSEKLAAGMVRWETGKPVIELSNSLAGPKRVSILIFELTNIYQQSRHHQIDEGARVGRITSPQEFGIHHELIELDGLRHHRNVLVELEERLGGIPPEMLQWINPELQKLRDYEVPFAHDYLQAQEAGGHTAHYLEWYWRQAPAAAR